MIVGNLYTYYAPRYVFNDEKHSQSIDLIKENEPFVVLKKGKKLKWTFKVLTIRGIIGWIRLGHPENIKPVEAL